MATGEAGRGLIKLLTAGPSGPLIVVGLTFADLDAVAAGRIVAMASEQLAVRPGFDIRLVGGAGTAIAARLQAWGIAVSAQRCGSLLVVTRRRAGRPLLVLGVGAYSDTALRAGARPLIGVPFARCFVQLAAAGDHAELADLIVG